MSALQEREHPPPYAMQQDSVRLPAVANNPPIHSQKIPTLEPLPSMLSTPPQHPLDPSPELVGARRGSGAYLPRPGTTPQSLQLPSVPSNEPLSRTNGLQAATRSTSVDSWRRDQSVSMEDPDDRMAAEALCGLGKVDSARSVRSTSGYEQPLKYYPMSIEHARSASADGDQEPLLLLLTSSHPWLGGTINGSLSAYSSTKSHTPRFIQSSAEFVERNIGSPMVQTVGSVGRKTGVERSLRQYLARQPNDVEHIDPEILGHEAGSKRRRPSGEDPELARDGLSMQRTMSGRTSIETLPLYDDNRSPAYEDEEAPGSLQTQQTPRSWSTQLMISTSGLGAALNETSLRSLKYVLSILRSANTRVRRLMEALKKILSDYAAGHDSSPAQKLEEGSFASLSEKDPQYNPRPHNQTPTVAERISHLNAEIWKTLKSVVNTVSRYTGGTLPENASVIVRWQLMSVPRRWQRASAAAAYDSGNGDGKAPAQDEKEALNSANRMLAFAVEGIDMMEQVGGVVDSTILSAERWLDSMGRRGKKEDATEQPQQPADPPMTENPRQESEDVRMGEGDESRQEEEGQSSAAYTDADADGMLVDTSS